jgi:class 3 adenylate cyclase/pimeloyl-ACP methyl ester carboxylesterase
VDFEPQTRFAELESGDRLAYQVIQAGGDDHVVWFQEMNQHLDLSWTDDSVVEVVGSLVRDGVSSLLLQERGVGLSDPVERKATVDEQAADVLAVMDAEGVRRATLVGTVTTALAVALVAARHPERVHGLLLIAPMIVGPLAAEGDHGWTLARAEQFTEGYRRCLAQWGSGRTLEMWDPGLATPYNCRLFAMNERCSLSVEMATAVVENAFYLDGRPIYSEVRVPTRVLRVAQPLVPDEAVRAVAEAIPGAEYVELARAQLGDSLGEMYRPILGHAAEMARGAQTRYGGADRVLATVLFTDIVGSTDNLARLGDTAWRQILDAHDQLLRRHVAAAGGRYVKNTGDGALCEFGSPGAAVECASKLCASAAELGIEIRAGVHAGECERRGEDLAGLAVHVGARVCAAAGPSEVLVSRTVCDLVAGSGLGFADRGERELKGVPGTWELFAAGRDTDTARVVVPTAARPRASDKVVMELSRRAPGALRTVNRLGYALQRRRFERRGS